MGHIAKQSQRWYQEEKERITSVTVRPDIRLKIELETTQEFESQLAYANWWQTLILKFKIRRLVNERCQKIVDDYIKKQNLPSVSEESLW